MNELEGVQVRERERSFEAQGVDDRSHNPRVKVIKAKEKQTIGLVLTGGRQQEEGLLNTFINDSYQKPLHTFQVKEPTVTSKSKQTKDVGQ